MIGKVHSYESFGAADGPGVRFIVFLYGCNFRCVYCHNPDTWATAREVTRHTDGADVSLVAREVTRHTDGADVSLVAREVTRHTDGADVSLVAREVTRHTDGADVSRATREGVSAQEVLAKALRYRSYWGEKGGITVSGGEPMLQAEFVAELFELAHAEGVNTCLDTAAGPFRRDSEPIKRLLAATDTVLLDLKAMDPELHRKVTGADNACVFDCARYLAEQDIATWIRHVNVPGLTDSAEEIKALEAFVATLPNVVKTEYLPYHTYGVEKWRKLGIPYPLEAGLTHQNSALPLRGP